MNPEGNGPKSLGVVDLTKPSNDSTDKTAEQRAAADQKTYQMARRKMIEAEERVDLFRSMIKKNLGTNETEGIVAKHVEKLRHRTTGIESKHTENLMNDKLRDAKKDARWWERKEIQEMKNLKTNMMNQGKTQRTVRSIVENIQKESSVERNKLKQKNKEKLENLVVKKE